MTAMPSCRYAIGTIPSEYFGADGNRLQGWVQRYFGGKSDIADGTQYGVAMYWAMMTMTTVRRSVVRMRYLGG
jgi:hypothetical protein